MGETKHPLLEESIKMVKKLDNASKDIQDLYERITFCENVLRRRSGPAKQVLQEELNKLREEVIKHERSLSNVRGDKFLYLAMIAVALIAILCFNFIYSYFHS